MNELLFYAWVRCKRSKPATLGDDAMAGNEQGEQIALAEVADCSGSFWAATGSSQILVGDELAEGDGLKMGGNLMGERGVWQGDRKRFPVASRIVFKPGK
jgi:hypothetical protein